MPNDSAEIILLDALTGRIAVRANAALPELTGQWHLRIGKNAGPGGNLRHGAMAAGETCDFPLSVRIPPSAPGENIMLDIALDLDPRVERSFRLPVYCRVPAEPSEAFYTVGVRFDPTQAAISGGKLAAVVTANGLRELRYRGRHLLNSGFRLQLWRDGNVGDDRIRALDLPHLPVSCDRFTSDGSGVECHALVLPRQMALDELEFTQRFTPLTDEAIRYELDFVVPDSFAGVPQLGVSFSPSPELSRAFSDHGGFAPGSAPMETEFVAFREDSGAGLLIAAAGEQPLTVIPGAAGESEPRTLLAIRAREQSAIAAGDHRAAWYLAPLRPKDDPAKLARALRRD